MVPGYPCMGFYKHGAPKEQNSASSRYSKFKIQNSKSTPLLLLHFSLRLCVKLM
jgi:hypothetical protein